MNRAGIYTGFLLSGLLHIAVLAATTLPGTGTVESAPGEIPLTVNLAMFEARPEPDVAQVAEPVPEPLSEPAPVTPESVQQPIAEPAPPVVQPLPRPKPKPAANTRPEPPTNIPVEAAPPATPALHRPTLVVTSTPAAHSEPQQAGRMAEDYLAALVKAIERHRFYPRMSRRLNEEGTVEVRFVVQRNGRLTDITVERSSGSQRLDEAALQTLGKTTPFAPLPAALEREQLSLTVPIVYRLQR